MAREDFMFNPIDELRLIFTSSSRSSLNESIDY